MSMHEVAKTCAQQYRSITHDYPGHELNAEEPL